MKKLILSILLIGSSAWAFPPCGPGEIGPTLCIPQNGTNGINGTDASANHLLSVNVGAGIRWYDWRYVSLNSGYRYDINHHDNEVDAMILDFKIGPDYTQRMMEKQNKLITALANEVESLKQQRIGQTANGPDTSENINYALPNSIWFVSSDGKVQKVMPKDTDYVKTLLKSNQ